jgi:hypothetical protein
MRKSVLTCLLACVFVFHSFGWGQTGHRVVGEIASFHLSKRAMKNIKRILGPESLAMVANWMDEIKSDPAYDSLYTWHYLTVKTGESYDPSIQEKSGDAYSKTKMIIAALKGGRLNQNDKKAYIKMLVHLIGDLHQPLHVGTGEDKGGNDVKLIYFNNNTNLHSVWDSRIIDGQKLSFTEIARHLNRRVTKDLILSYQNDPIEKWLQEAVDLRPLVYDIPKNKRLYYPYAYVTYPVIEERLLAGGIRLAGILNELFG